MPSMLARAAVVTLAACVAGPACADLVEIEVGSNFYRTISPVPGQGTDIAQIRPGDTVRWTWSSGLHSVTADDGSFDSGLHPTPFVYERVFPDAGTIPYYCFLHGAPGGLFMAGTLVVGEPCPADVNIDRVVDILDLLFVLVAYGDPGGPEDINGDGRVDVLDILEVLEAWGPCP